MAAKKTLPFFLDACDGEQAPSQSGVKPPQSRTLARSSQSRRNPARHFFTSRVTFRQIAKDWGSAGEPKKKLALQRQCLHAQGLSGPVSPVHKPDRFENFASFLKTSLKEPTGKCRAKRRASSEPSARLPSREGKRWLETLAEILRTTGQVIYDRKPGSPEMTFSGDLLRLLGYSEAEMDGGWPRWLELVHPDDREVFQKLGVAARSGQPFQLEYRLQRKDGKIATLRDSGCAFEDGETGAVRVAGILRDISEQREMISQLQHARKMEAFGRLAGGVAHDFNNLLTVFGGYNEMLAGELDPRDPRLEYIEEMRRAVNRATALTSQLLSFSRLQRSSPQAVDLNGVLLDLRKMMRRLIGEDVEIVTKLTDRPGAIMADPRQIETVLINLAVNARDAMPQGGRLMLETANISIRVGDRRILAGWKPGPYVLLTVSDTGFGMDEAVRMRAFEPFFTTKAPGHGTGQGLSTCYGIVEDGSGHIAVESAPGKGTVVRIYFPRIRKGARKDCNEAGPTGELPLGKGETILLVEDDPSVRKFYASLLKRLAYTVLCASNGDEALRIAGQHPEISLVIADVVMPLMNGTDLTRIIRNTLPKTKVVLTSGYASEPEPATGNDPWVIFLPKPLARDILAHKLRELLEIS